MEFAIRPASAGDYPEICRLSEEVDALHRHHLPYIYQKPDGPAREWAYIRHLIESHDVGFFVAHSDGEPVDKGNGGLAGFVVVMLENAPDIPLFMPRKYANVENLVVDERFHRRGLGRALMEAVETWALAMGAVEVRLNVYEFNRGARALYQSLGYRPLSIKMSRRLDG